MGRLMRMMAPGRRDVKSMALMGAASWAVSRVARRHPAVRGGMMAMNTATWAVPLGMMAVNRLRARRGGG